MSRFLNTLYVTTQGAYITKDGENIVVNIDGKIHTRVPVHVMDGIVCFGRVMISPPLMGLCMKNGVSISFLTEHGKFLGRVVGSTSGNVLLRREQYRWADDLKRSASIASMVIFGKILNQRAVIRRALRDHSNTIETNKIQSLQKAEKHLTLTAKEIEFKTDLDTIRGLEGEVSRTYFDQFNSFIFHGDGKFEFNGRNRRPPLDRTNAMLSYVYTLFVHDVRSALESVGLDPSVGFLHRDRPGRPSLALDMMEEFRPWFCDRLVLSLINRKQIMAKHFTIMDDHACMMSDSARKTLIIAYQKRKRESIRHDFLSENTTIGTLWHIQAKLLARHIRGDLNKYPPFVWK